MYSLSNSAFMSPGLGCLVHTLFTQLNRWWGPGDCILGNGGTHTGSLVPVLEKSFVSLWGRGKETRGSTAVKGDKGLWTLSLGETKGVNNSCVIPFVLWAVFKPRAGLGLGETAGQRPSMAALSLKLWFLLKDVSYCSLLSAGFIKWTFS